MTNRFAYLAARDISTKTADVRLPQIAAEATIKVRPATDSNVLYYNDLLRRFGALRATPTKDRNEEVGRHRSIDRELYPEYIIVGWSGMPDDKGNDVPFSKEAAQELCAVLPDWLFDRLRAMAMTAETFLGPSPDSAELSGNSETA